MCVFPYCVIHRLLLFRIKKQREQRKCWAPQPRYTHTHTHINVYTIAEASVPVTWSQWVTEMFIYQFKVGMWYPAFAILVLKQRYEFIVANTPWTFTEFFIIPCLSIHIHASNPT